MSEAEETIEGELVEEPAVAEGGEQPEGDQADGGEQAAAGAEGSAAGEQPAGGDDEQVDYHDRWLRAAAELDNVRKRARRDAGLGETRGVLRLARELLPSIDNLDRALAAAEAQPENADHHLTDGIRLVHSEMLAALERVGIVPDSPKGEQFDPHRHEAVAQQPVDGTESGTVVEVYQPGYRLGDEVVRAAKVVVAA